MPIAGLEVEDDALSGRISVLSGLEQGLGKAWLPKGKWLPQKKIPKIPLTPKEAQATIQQKVQASIWDTIINDIKKKLGL
jgi:hypothetical protein